MLSRRIDPSSLAERQRKARRSTKFNRDGPVSKTVREVDQANVIPLSPTRSLLGMATSGQTNSQNNRCILYELWQ
jgi:hypothetical protein